jgi:hypothetical protein
MSYAEQDFRMITNSEKIKTWNEATVAYYRRYYNIFLETHRKIMDDVHKFRAKRKAFRQSVTAGMAFPDTTAH